MEGRAGANGRLRSQSTCRTQRRESVIQEAPRPRRRASRRNASKVRRSSDRRQEPCALARLHGSVRGAPGNRRPYRDGAASDVTAKSVQSEAASASSPTPISHQLTSDVIAGTRGARPLAGSIGSGGKPRHVPGGRGGPIQRWFASTGTVSSRGLFAIYPRIFTATNTPTTQHTLHPNSLTLTLVGDATDWTISQARHPDRTWPMSTRGTNLPRTDGQFHVNG